MNDKYAIIVAGGSGLRMHVPVPKQFIVLAGKPVLMHTLEAFHAYDPGMKQILVLPPGQIAFWEKLCREYAFRAECTLVAGGDTRYYSVKNGLEQIPGIEGRVAVHDGVRPLVSAALLARIFDGVAAHECVIPVIPVSESLRKKEGAKSISVDRSLYSLAQTPQCFRLTVLKEAYSRPYNKSFTDDASVVEAAGFPVHLTEGEKQNIKITTPEDLLMAEALITKNTLEQ